MGRPKRILNIITHLERGGAPQTLLDTLSAIDQSEFEIDLAAGQVDNPDLDLLKRGYVPPFPLHIVHSMRRSIHPVRDAVAFLQLYRIVRRGKYALVHTHTSKAGFLGRLAAAAAGVRVIIHSPHGSILHGYFSPSLTRFYVALERFAALVSTRIICLTRLEIAQNLSARIGRKGQYTSIYNGIDLAQFKPRPERRKGQRKSLRLNETDVVCVTVGRLVPVKGHHHLLRAFELAGQGDDRLRLVIVGDGELRPELNELARDSDIGDRISFVGWRSDVSEVLDAADIFVLSSLNEGLGLVLLEAMAKGLPIIATAVGGVPEVIGDSDSGLLVPPADPSALAAAISRLAGSESLRDRIGRSGLKRVRSTFSIGAAACQTGDLYRNQLSS